MTGSRGLAANGGIPDIAGALALGLHRREPLPCLLLRKVVESLSQRVVIHAQSIARPRAFLRHPHSRAPTASTGSTQPLHMHVPLHAPAGARGDGGTRGCGRSCSAHTCVCLLGLALVRAVEGAGAMPQEASGFLWRRVGKGDQLVTKHRGQGTGAAGAAGRTCAAVAGHAGGRRGGG